jgi:hypothetical protein
VVHSVLGASVAKDREVPRIPQNEIDDICVHVSASQVKPGHPVGHCNVDRDPRVVQEQTDDIQVSKLARQVKFGFSFGSCNVDCDVMLSQEHLDDFQVPCLARQVKSDPPLIGQCRHDCRKSLDEYQRNIGVVPIMTYHVKPNLNRLGQRVKVVRHVLDEFCDYVDLSVFARQLKPVQRVLVHCAHNASHMLEEFDDDCNLSVYACQMKSYQLFFVFFAGRCQHDALDRKVFEDFFDDFEPPILARRVKPGCVEQDISDEIKLLLTVPVCTSVRTYYVVVQRRKMARYLLDEFTDNLDVFERACKLKPVCIQKERLEKENRTRA